ncbi:P-loop NTPase fold protein [Actinoplanes sp. NPDC023936]|uniref:KAP family P-loop NTPase fold protein n=1 Tax=Actinoplanes sp. NPDC023936 TaxID=3154910 RepID=UPI0033CC1D80
MRVSLIPDQAIGESAARADGLGFRAYSRVLAAAASQTRGPFTIGVFGEWGMGKTSLMRLIQGELDSDPEIVTVWFNAWRYEKEEHPIVPLVGTIVHELENRPGLLQKLGDGGKSLVRSLRAIAYGFSSKAKLKVPGFAEIEASFVAKDMIERDDRLRLDPLLDRSLYYGAFQSLEAVRIADQVRVVILIDDLDRCFPDQAIRLLESIKLVLSQPEFVFVLGVSRRVIEGYLSHRYTSEYGISDFKGALYLDKIVQLPFHIPRSSGRMADFCRDLLAGQPAEMADEMAGLMPIVAEALDANPRAVVRYVNNILIDVAINSELAAESDLEAVPVRYFAVSRALEHRWPDVFARLSRSDELAAGVATWEPSSLAARAAGIDDEAQIATALVTDSQLVEILFSGPGRDWLTDAGLRTASVSFLKQRRFSAYDYSAARSGYDTLVLAPATLKMEALRLAQGLSGNDLKIFLDYYDSAAAEWRKPPTIPPGVGVCVLVGPEELSPAGVTGVTELIGGRPNAALVRVGGSPSAAWPAEWATFTRFQPDDVLSPEWHPRLAEALRPYEPELIVQKTPEGFRMAIDVV